jgi:hypothetical protein
MTILRPTWCWNGKGREHTDDRNNDDQFGQPEAALV